ncbi:unnamed protein product [Protopolystoma xenopodis]|uniref:Uncharacterized protein n=1 Tax=Protopolystoma xenopodis TaxID=117903 RepID=A0A3S4ZXF9_9PLAT|nr:unnamed protein product [Protopolystoma xenopodis]
MFVTLGYIYGRLIDSGECSSGRGITLVCFEQAVDANDYSTPLTFRPQAAAVAYGSRISSAPEHFEV